MRILQGGEYFSNVWSAVWSKNKTAITTKFMHPRRFSDFQLIHVLLWHILHILLPLFGKLHNSGIINEHDLASLTTVQNMYVVWYYMCSFSKVQCQWSTILNKLCEMTKSVIKVYHLLWMGVPCTPYVPLRDLLSCVAHWLYVHWCKRNSCK